MLTIFATTCYVMNTASSD